MTALKFQHSEYNNLDKKINNLHLLEPSVSENRGSPAREYLLFKLSRPLIEYIKFLPINIAHWFVGESDLSKEEELFKRKDDPSHEFHNLYFF